MINTVRYPDDTVLLTSKMDDMQHRMEKLNGKCAEYGLEINLKKRMVVTKFLCRQQETNLRVPDIMHFRRPIE